MSKQPTFLGMDLETNGSTVPSAAPIQIGIYGIGPTGLTATYESLIYWPEISEEDWSSEAEAIHGISYSSALYDGIGVRHVTKEIADMFNEHGIVKPIPIGFNVAGFDLTTLRDWHQPLWNLFSHRSVDLNALCFFLGSLGLPRKDSPNPWTFATLKKYLKRTAVDRLEGHGWKTQVHDAHYDAVLAWECWTILQEIMEPWTGLLNQTQKGLFV